jgi:hypothetical protein
LRTRKDNAFCSIFGRRVLSAKAVLKTKKPWEAQCKWPVIRSTGEKSRLHSKPHEPQMPIIDSLAKGVMAKVCSGWRNRVKSTRFLGRPERLLAATSFYAGFRHLFRFDRRWPAGIPNETWRAGVMTELSLAWKQLVKSALQATGVCR